MNASKNHLASVTLSSTQERALAFIKAQIDLHGVPPSLREICEFMGYSAIGSAQDVVAALRKKGFLNKPEKRSARTLVPTGFADDTFNPQDLYYTIPKLGSVPAGNPLEAVESHSGTMQIAKSLLPRPLPSADELFALQTSGDSMLLAGIIDGDYLVVRSAKSADEGQIVVARLGEGDATCKRLKKDKKRGWLLQPENPKYSPIFADQNDFEVIGVVVALQRTVND